MNFLFFIGEYNGYVNAGKRIALSLAKSIKKNNICKVVSFSYRIEKKQIITIDDIEVEVYPANSKMFQIRKEYIEKRKTATLDKTVINHPIIALEYFFSFFSQRTEMLECINKSIVDNEVNSIVCFYNPFVPTRDIINHVKCQRKILYQLDSAYLYEQNIILKAIRKIQEFNIFMKADRIFTIPTLYNIYSNNGMYKCIMKKITKVNHPNFVKKHRNNTNIINIDDKAINILYLGAIDDNVRNPETILRKITNLAINNGMDIKIYIIGKNTSKTCSKYSKMYPNIISILKEVDSNTANSLMTSDFFLLNIGNNETYQIPSKIIDYISTGNPIICEIKSLADPCIEILKNYDNKIIVSKETKESDILEFIKAKKNIKLDYNETKEKYIEFTPEYVSSLICNEYTIY